MTLERLVQQGFCLAGGLILVLLLAPNAQSATAHEIRTVKNDILAHGASPDGWSWSRLSLQADVMIVLLRHGPKYTDRLEEVWQTPHLASRMKRSQIGETVGSRKGLGSDQSIGDFPAAQKRLLCVQLDLLGSS